MRQTEPAEALDKLIRFCVEYSMSFRIFWGEASATYEVTLLSLYIYNANNEWWSNEWPFLSNAVDAAIANFKEDEKIATKTNGES